MLRLLVDGVRSSMYELDATCFTKSYSAGNDTIDSVMTRGVVGGSIAEIADGGADYTVIPATGENAPVGLFLNDAAGAAFDNNHALASNKLGIVRQQASVEVDVYETDGITYKLGDKLYASADGLLTNVESTNATVIGIVTKVATPSSPFMGVDMLI